MTYTSERAISYSGARSGDVHAGPCALRVADRLRRAGLWDGQTPIVIADPSNLWPAVNAGDVTPDELTPGTHYTIGGAQ